MPTANYNALPVIKFKCTQEKASLILSRSGRQVRDKVSRDFMEKMRVEEDRRPRKFDVVTFQMWQFSTRAYSFENSKHAQIISSIPLRLHKRQCKGDKGRR